ncbi:MAG TPA: helix-turn-helix transcriptional regulator [Actinomycetota bacterium]|nr:helix-turn-helix transcriptional regulator [Actinomycetota bacterium]
MSLRHAILGVLSAEPMSGYDLVQLFDSSVAFVWSAPQSQIYPKLREMEREGLVEANVLPRGQRAEKRVYSITAAGERELEDWANRVVAHGPFRDAVSLKAAFFDIASPDSVRAQLDDHVAYYERARRQWQNIAEAIRERRAALIRKRLEKRPPGDHDALIGFKALAFDRLVALADAELAWAARALELLDQLEPALRSRADERRTG